MAVIGKTRYSASLLLLAFGLFQSAAAKELTIEVEKQGEFITVNASARMQVDPSVAWAVLSDYDHLAQFIPDMKSSRVVSRSGDRVLVEQRGEISFIFYHQPVEVTLDVVEQPQRRIAARRVDGNIRALETRYELELSDGGIRLDYIGRFTPDFFLPPLIGMPIMRRIVERRFRAMVEEIERRDALARAGPQR
jgi:ribosome-associated toxin RatA of RatAB toxin-antitoxin module